MYGRYGSYGDTTVLPSNVTEIPYRLNGQVALITGASRGLGRHFARTLSRAGAKVAACGRSKALLQELIEEITANGGSAWSFSLDVTDSANVAATVKSVTENLGPINILVNNAAVPGGLPESP